MRNRHLFFVRGILQNVKRTTHNAQRRTPNALLHCLLAVSFTRVCLRCAFLCNKWTNCKQTEQVWMKLNLSKHDRHEWNQPKANNAIGVQRLTNYPFRLALPWFCFLSIIIITRISKNSDSLRAVKFSHWFSCIPWSWQCSLSKSSAKMMC